MPYTTTTIIIERCYREVEIDVSADVFCVREEIELDDFKATLNGHPYDQLTDDEREDAEEKLKHQASANAKREFEWRN